MIVRILAKTLSIFQLIAFFLALSFGLIISLTVIYFYFDVKQVFFSDLKFEEENILIISKKATIFKTINKKDIYFTEKELQEIKNQDFIEDFAYFRTALFNVSATMENNPDYPYFYTDMFLQSIPNRFLDVNLKNWTWDTVNRKLSIIIPRQYLQLYNLGFAQAQGLPILSESLIKKIPFTIKIGRDGKFLKFKTKIIGFSNYINSILAPDDFLIWANKKFANTDENKKVSRIIIKVKDISDPKISKFIKKHNYFIENQNIKQNKIFTAFKISILIFQFIGIIIISLSILFILMSLNFIVYKNRDLLSKLFNIGFQQTTLCNFYFSVSALITIIATIVSYFAANFVRDFYINLLKQYFNFAPAEINLKLYIILFIAILLILIRFSLRINLKKAIK